jgi:NADPH2:quinone reductase
MKAIGINKFGGREVLEPLELPTPQPGPNEILIQIKAAGVNPVDYKIREGLFKGRMPHEFPIILGWDAAGVVESVGTEVKSFKKGDEVFAYCRKEKIHDGTYAEYIVVEPRHLALKPKNLSFEEAAALPLAGLTAYQSLFEGIQLKPGETILIHAGAGGVGGYAIQFAKNIGAHVITTASGKNAEYVKSLGADEVVDYGKEDFVNAIKKTYRDGIDAVFDTVGGDTQKKSADVLKKGGRITSILAMDENYFKERGVIPHYVFVRPDSEQLCKIKELVEQGKLKVHLAATLPLAEARKALEMIESGHTRGKLVLRVS